MSITNNIEHNVVKNHYPPYFGFSPKPLMISPITLRMSSEEGTDENSDRKSIEIMKQMLEASWNADTMGTVPTTPESAAESASAAISNALTENKNMLFVDLLLPAYDISQGFNVYDDVLAVEFCIALSNELVKKVNESKKCAILVKDGKSERSVSRVLNVKEKQTLETEDDVDYDYYEEEEEEEILMEDTDGIGSVVEFDDFSDFGESSGSFYNDFEDNAATPEEKNDIDSFRQNVIQNWDGINPDGEIEEKEYSLEEKPKKKKRKKKKKQNVVDASPKTYRLGSLFGDSRISTGPDMFDDAMDAVDKNVFDTDITEDQEDTLIVLSAFSEEEMIGVRRLVAKHKDTKTIIFVNCKLNPIPRELIFAETVYSILPLIARPVQSKTNILSNNESGNSQQGPSSPKIVVLRRFPNDWEVHVDADGQSGFELADIVPSAMISTSESIGGSKGPSGGVISTIVKKFMSLKFGTSP